MRRMIILTLVLSANLAQAAETQYCRNDETCSAGETCEGFIAEGPVGAEVWSDPVPFAEVLGHCTPETTTATESGNALSTAPTTSTDDQIGISGEGKLRNEPNPKSPLAVGFDTAVSALRIIGPLENGVRNVQAITGAISNGK